MCYVLLRVVVALPAVVVGACCRSLRASSPFVLLPTCFWSVCPFQRAGEELQAARAKGMNKAEAWNAAGHFLFQASRAHCLVNIAQNFVEATREVCWAAPFNLTCIDPPSQCRVLSRDDCMVCGRRHARTTPASRLQLHPTWVPR